MERSRGTDLPSIVQNTTERGLSVPRILLLRSFYGLLLLLDAVHEKNIIWNDVKVEHIFWEPTQEVITIIDWANGQFTEENGETKDLNFSFESDYVLYIEMIGRYLKKHFLHLFNELGWPDPKTWNKKPEVVNELRISLNTLLEQETKKLSNVKTKETKILDNLSKGKYQDIQFEIEKLQTVQSELLEYGDELHTEKTKKALNVILKKLAIEQNFDDFDFVAHLLSAISENKDVKKWQTVCRTIRRCGNKIKYSSELSNALVKIITDDKFEDLLWVTAKEMPDKWLPTTSKEIRN